LQDSKAVAADAAEQAAVAAETGPASAGRDGKQPRSYAAAATATAGASSADGSGPRRVMQQSQPSGRKDKTLVVQHSTTGGQTVVVSSVAVGYAGGVRLSVAFTHDRVQVQELLPNPHC
jgi:hypothetical protein